MNIEDPRREPIPDLSASSSQAAEIALKMAIETPSVLRMRREAGGTRAYIAALLQQELEGQPTARTTFETSEPRALEPQLQEFGNIAV